MHAATPSQCCFLLTLHMLWPHSSSVRPSGLEAAIRAFQGTQATNSVIKHRKLVHIHCDIPASQHPKRQKENNWDPPDSSAECWCRGEGSALRVVAALGQGLQRQQKEAAYLPEMRKYSASHRPPGQLLLPSPPGKLMSSVPCASLPQGLPLQAVQRDAGLHMLQLTEPRHHVTRPNPDESVWQAR